MSENYSSHGNDGQRADGASDPADASDQTVGLDAESQSQEALAVSLLLKSRSDAAAAATRSQDSAAGGSRKAVGSHQILFIDSRVADIGGLLQGLASGTEVYILNPDEDGLAQIARLLGSRTDVPVISVIGHGNQGEIELGSSVVTETTLNQSQTVLAAIGHAVAPQGDILLYGCDVGEGAAGQQFVDSFAAATGARVAAASHVVGDLAAGDGWNLDTTSTGSAIKAPQVLSSTAMADYTHPLVINAPPTGLPITITSFTGSTAFDEAGTTTINSSGYLQLTSTATNQDGIAVYNQSFPSTAGLSVQFTYYSGGGTGADGISFFLLNADEITAAGHTAANVTAGGYGGGLGYSDDGSSGITDGFLGLGLDTYGNYTAVDRGQTGNAAAAPNEIAVRGAGSGTTGYALLTNAAYTPGIDGTRTVKVNLVKTDSTHESLSVFMSSDGGVTYQEVITNYAVAQTLPSNFYLGFAASTGGSTDTHEIENLSVTLPVNLAVSAPVITYPNSTDSSSLTLQPGDAFSYTYKLTDSGPNGSSNITLQDALPSNVLASSVHWTLQDDLHPAGSLESGTGTISLSNINLSSGDSATVTVYGTVSSSASNGNVSHTITATPGTGFSFLTPSSGVVAQAIGSPNPYLVGTNATASDTGTTPLQLFSAAQVADAHTSPTITATIGLFNSAGTLTDANGTLSGTGLTETATKGVYTLTASGTSAFNADLEALLFTPTSSTKSVLTTVGMSVSDGVSGTTPATATTAVTTTCFLAGTRILTEHGEVAVERLLALHQARKPDEAAIRVATLVEGEVCWRPVVWVGGRRIDAAAAAADRLYPIRIRRHALADEVPHRDLLVTPEHCIFIAGRLIPARMLVNGGSIVEDRTVGGYAFYHVELAEHGILLAEGLPAESYLDTGNRACFSNAAVTALRPGLLLDTGRGAGRGAGRRSWSADACAPLTVDRETVEPLWRQLARRAALLGLRTECPPVALSDDPELRLLLADGRVLEASGGSRGCHMFSLPRGAQPVVLGSRAAVPADLIGPFLDDRRRLGVAVQKLVLWHGLSDTVLAAAELDLPGWHPAEGGVRWTDGHAALDLPACEGPDSFLAVHLAATLRYPARQDRAEAPGSAEDDVRHPIRCSG